jgi:hypothetical protein
MKKNQTGFAFLEILIITVILSALTLIGWTVYSKHIQQNDNSVHEQIIKSKEGTQSIKMLPGLTIVNLPSGDILRFGNTGSETSVPDFIFGKDYTLNDMHNINYLPIKKVLEAYSNGYNYKLTNTGCQTERKFDIDVEITVVTNCIIEVQATKTKMPTVNSSNFTKSLSIEEKEGAPLRKSLNPDPYLFVGATNMRVTKTGDGSKVYSDSGDWEVYIITNFGIETVKYTAEELYAQKTKSIVTGPAKVDIVIDSLTCAPPYNPAADCKTPYASVYDKIDFTVKYSSTRASQDVKILDYQE